MFHNDTYVWSSGCWSRIVFTLFVETATRVCPVVVDGQVSICGRYSSDTTISQQPGKVASVRDSIYAEEGIVQIDQVTVKNSWGRLVFVLDWMSLDLEDL